MIIEQIDYNHLANNDKTEEEWTPLHWAVYKGHVDVCRLILTKANIMNTKFENGNTLLHFAVKVCQIEVCKLLLENIQDKNPANDVQSTPLHWAICNASCTRYPHYYLEICKLLWSYVEDKNAVLNMVNLNSGKTLKEELVKGDYRDERCEEVFKLFKV